jgi:dihydroorotate dehydrogenase
MFATTTQRFLYRHVLKPWFFIHDPENIHDAMTRLGARLGRFKLTRACLSRLMTFHHPALEQTICGMHFPNPVGLTAGFDKNAQLTEIIPSVGFGFEVVGSVTARPCIGNPKPRLWRLPKSKGLVVHYGLKNDGANEIFKRLDGRSFKIPLGISIAKTNDSASVGVSEGIQDYLQSLNVLHETGDFFVINVSCPNAYGGETFTVPDRLDSLLCAVDDLHLTKPVFLKLPVDITTQDLDRLIHVMDRHHVDGMILSNLTKKRERSEINSQEIADIQVGGISGEPIRQASTKLIHHAYQKTKGSYVIVGVGGIFCAEDAYEKICAGATLVKLATGIIFEGPQLIGQINRGLVRLLERDGFHSVTEAVGSAHR